MAHDDDYDANDNDVGPKGVKGGRRRGMRKKREEKKKEGKRRGGRKEEITEESNFRYRLPAVPLKLRALRGGDAVTI